MKNTQSASLSSVTHEIQAENIRLDRTRIALAFVQFGEGAAAGKVTGSLPIAQKVESPARAPGAVLGKALAPLASGRGTTRSWSHCPDRAMRHSRCRSLRWTR